MVKYKTRQSTANQTKKRVNQAKSKNLIKQIEPKMTTINLDGILQSLPNFDGKKESNLNFFINEFEQLARETKISDTLKLILLKSKLSGAARELLLNTTELREESNYDNFKKLLKENFKTKESFEDTQEKFLTLKQTPDQTIDDFAKVLNIAAAKYLQQSGYGDKEGAKDFLNLIKLTRFVDGVRPDIAFEIRKSGIKNFEQALEIGKSVELAHKMMNKEVINNITQNESKLLCDSLLNQNKIHAEEINALKEEIKTLKINKTDTPKRTYCDICKITSHDTDSCWFNAKNDNNRAQRRRFHTQYYQTPHNYIQHQYPQANMPMHSQFNIPQSHTPVLQSSYTHLQNQYPQLPQNNFPRLTQNSHIQHFPQNQQRFRGNTQYRPRQQTGRRNFSTTQRQTYNNNSPIITFPEN